MAQTSVFTTPPPGIPGMLGDMGNKRIMSRVLENAVAQPFGIFLKEGVAVNGADLLGAVTDRIAGIAIKSDAHAIDGLTGDQSINQKDIFDVLEEGNAWVRAEQDMVPGDEVYVRFAATAGGAGGTAVIGVVRKDNDTNTAMFLKGARVVRAGVSFNAAKMAQIQFSKPVQNMQDMVEIPFSHAGGLAATTTVGIMLSSSKRQFVVDEVVYDNPTGFVQDAANTWKVEIKRGATSIAKWDTTTGVEGTLAADTFVKLTNAAAANLIVPPATRLDLVITKTAAPANFPAGSGFIRGHYV